MSTLMRLFEHNAWATRQVLDGLGRAPAGFLEQQARDGADSNLERLRHLAGVERAFLDAVRGDAKFPDVPEDLAGAIAHQAETVEGYRAFLAGSPALETEVFIPWWERSFTVADCLHQVLAHTAQHRAELAWELARAGVDTGEMDYIMWVDAQSPAS